MQAIGRTLNYKSESKTGWANHKYLLCIGMVLTIIAITIIMMSLISSVSLAKPITVDYKYEPVIIEKGDTLWALTAKHNAKGDINELVNKTICYNNLPSTFIEPGQTIYIPVRV